MEALMPDRLVTPQMLADEGVDAIGSDQHIGIMDRAIGEGQAHAPASVLDRHHMMVQLENTGRKGIDHPLVQAPAQQADETTTIFGLNLFGQLNIGAALALGVLEIGVARRAQILRINANQLEHLLRRRPEIENIAGGLDLPCSLEKRHIETQPDGGKRGGHTSRPRSDNCNAPLGYRHTLSLPVFICYLNIA
jgi:hypothetical protein